MYVAHQTALPGLFASLTHISCCIPTRRRPDATWEARESALDQDRRVAHGPGASVGADPSRRTKIKISGPPRPGGRAPATAVLPVVIVVVIVFKKYEL
eukprot:SAG31_NODE_11371_length_1037_cov_1.987207_2_plen_98_part_00